MTEHGSGLCDGKKFCKWSKTHDSYSFLQKQSFLTRWHYNNGAAVYETPAHTIRGEEKAGSRVLTHTGCGKSHTRLRPPCTSTRPARKDPRHSGFRPPAAPHPARTAQRLAGTVRQSGCRRADGAFSSSPPEVLFPVPQPPDSLPTPHLSPQLLEGRGACLSPGPREAGWGLAGTQALAGAACCTDEAPAASPAGRPGTPLPFQEPCAPGRPGYLQLPSHGHHLVVRRVVLVTVGEH